MRTIVDAIHAVMPAGLRARLAGVWTDRRGTTVVEFAIVAAPFLALMLATFEVALTFFAQQGLETAAEVSSRSIMTGTAQKANTTQAQFKALACKQLPPFLSCSNLMVDVQKASSFSAINMASPVLTFGKNGQVKNSWSYTPGGAGDIVILRLMYIWSTPLGPLHLNLSNLSNGRRLLLATSVFKSEPYP